MNVGRRDEHVDAPSLGGPDGVSRQIDVAIVAAGQRRDDGPPYLLGHVTHSAEVAIGCRGETGLQYIDAEHVELTRQSQFFFGRHGVAGGLFPVAQSRVEDDDVSIHSCSPE